MPNIIRFFLVIRSAFFLLMVLQSPHLISAEPLISIQEYHEAGQNLSIVSIFERETSLSPFFNLANPDESFSRMLINYLKNWVPETYIKLGLVQRESAIHKALLNEEQLDDERSIIIFICEENDLSKIRAMVRFSRRGISMRSTFLPMKLRKPLESPDFPLEAGEIKNFFHLPEGPQSFMNLLLWKVIQSGSLDESFQSHFLDGLHIYGKPSLFTVETYLKAAKNFRRLLNFEDVPQASLNADDFGIYLYAQNAALKDSIKTRIAPSFSLSTQRHLPIKITSLQNIFWKGLENFPGKGKLCEHSILDATLPFYIKIGDNTSK